MTLQDAMITNAQLGLLVVSVNTINRGNAIARFFTIAESGKANKRATDN